MPSSAAHLALSETEEQLRLVRESAAAFAADEATPKRFRARRDAEIDFSPEVWRKMAALGWTGAVVPEAHGGYPISLAELCAIAEAFGKTLMPEPFVPSVVF